VHLSATDAPAGPALSSSGVANIKYSVDSAPALTASGNTTDVTITPPADHSHDGLHTIEYWATDNATNEESHHTATVKIDTTKPDVTIDQASTQVDQTNASPIHFTAAYNEAVSGFTGTDVTISGTAGGSLTAYVTDSGDHKTYDVAVSGMTTDGTVVASIPAGGASDAA